MLALSNPRVMGRAYQAEYKPWLARGDMVPAWRYIAALNAFIKRGKASGWFPLLNIYIFAAPTQALALNNIVRNFYNGAMDNMTFAPMLGFQGNGGASPNGGRVNFGVTMSACAQIAGTSNTIGAYLVGADGGTYALGGANGSYSWGIRPWGGSGPTGAAWGNSTGTLSITTKRTEGYVAISRTDASNVTLAKDGAITSLSQAYGGMPTSNIYANVLGVSNSHSIVPMAAFFFGGALSGAQHLDLEAALIAFFVAAGTAVPDAMDALPPAAPLTSGFNAFGKTTINSAVHFTSVIMNASPPASDANDGVTAGVNDYAYFPLTTAMTRAWSLSGTWSGAGIAAPRVGGKTGLFLWGNRGRQFDTGETVPGLPPAPNDPNGPTITRWIVNNVATNDTGVSPARAYAAAGNLTLDGVLAVGGVAYPGVAAQVRIVSSGNDTARSFTVTGTDASGAAISETKTGGNAAAVTTTAAFLTITQIGINGASAGTVAVGTVGTLTSRQCRPEFTTHRTSAGASVVQLSYMLGAPATGDAADPDGEGWRDKATRFGLSTAGWNAFDASHAVWTTDDAATKTYVAGASSNVIHSAYALSKSQALFDRLSENGAFWATRDMVILPPTRAIDGRASLVWLDAEMSDYRPEADFNAYMRELGRIAHARGLKFYYDGHDLSGGQAARNGARIGSFNTLFADPAGKGGYIDRVPLVVQAARGGRTVEQFLDDQIAFMTNNGAVAFDPNRVFFKVMVGVASNGLSVADAIVARDYAIAKNIREVYFARLNHPQGGDMNSRFNQIVNAVLQLGM